MVIGDRPLDQLVPLYRDTDNKESLPATQFNMKWVETAGLVKFDFLGLKTLTVIEKACELVGRSKIDIAKIPLDDEPTFRMLAKGDAYGVFQMEGSGMRDILAKLKPNRFEDLIALVALYRPGPMDDIPTYISVKNGQEKADYLHPSLKGILEETYGIMVYQEQVMQIAQKMGGYSLGSADLLRRAMGKKIRAEMDAQRKSFVDGATGRGIPAAKAEEVFDLMAKFADYGFNKSHAAAYALVAYQTAWMKANHPEAFIAACMSLAMGNTDKLAALRQEAARMGIAILPPDINRSGPDFTLERQDGKLAIRYALAAGKKVGFAAMQALAEARGHYGFADLADLAARVDPKQINKMQLENLARAGAFDNLDKNRARVFAGAETVLRRAQATREEKFSGQIGLFAGGNEPEILRLPEIPDWDEMDRLGFEAEAIGFHLTAHPLDAYAQVLRRMHVVPSDRLEAQAKSGASRVKLAGLVVNTKARITRSGSRMAWVRLSDAGGSYEVTFFSEALARAGDLLKEGRSVIVTADVKLEGEALRITAVDAQVLDEAATQAGAGMRVWLQQTAALAHIRSLLDREGRGRGQVVLVPRLDDRQNVEITLPGGFNVTPRLAQALKVLPGVERVEEL